MHGNWNYGTWDWWQNDKSWDWWQDDKSWDWGSDGSDQQHHQLPLDSIQSNRLDCWIITALMD